MNKTTVEQLILPASLDRHFTAAAGISPTGTFISSTLFDPLSNLYLLNLLPSNREPSLIFTMSTPRDKRQKVDKEKENPTAPDFQRFVPHGDVVFIVNNDRRVRVHSTVMKDASRVFATMLGPNFMEGQALAAANTETDHFEIALPEEESSLCFGWICRALHCQSETTLWSPTCAEIVKVWSIIDKYDMKQSMHLSVMFWTQDILSKTCHSKDIWLMALICFQNQDSASYTTATRKLLSDGGSFLARASETEKRSESNMPGRSLYRLAANLQASQIELQRKVAKLVYNEIPSLIYSNYCPTATIRTLYFDHLVELMPENGHPCFLDPEAPLSRVDQALSKLDNWLSYYRTEHEVECETCAESQHELRKTIRDKRPRLSGLCLGCFEGDNTCPAHKK
ncbi:hypothetical protein FMEXI_9664 [Fusarium mexicanum]|uniref:BTB domain-containing protein n=1 Tax=Fusarium mexicanum TaxID=751941 RepID=A0A8H5IJ94_9HYPO|nr:hypothetical protein FMEXI_9664 [Fusarium mexicanum]